MKFALVLIVLASSTAVLTAWHNDPKCGIKPVPSLIDESKIYNGQEAVPHEFPWMLELKLFGSSTCGASILNSRWAITAAHCVLNGSITYDPLQVELSAGVHNRANHSEPSRVDISVEKIVAYPSYAVNYDGDIALLKFKEELTLNDNGIGPICLPKQDDKIDSLDGKVATVSGWGEMQNHQYPDVLQKVNVTIWKQSYCLEAYQMPISELMVCAEDYNKDSCGGDSGGPLVVYDPMQGRWNLEGVVSWGSENCGTPYKPGVYARVRKLMSWIEKTVVKNS